LSEMETESLAQDRLGTAELSDGTKKTHLGKTASEFPIEEIALVLPTRKRPDQFTRMYRSALETAALPGAVSCSIYIDDDDLESLRQIESAVLPRLTVTVGPRILLSAAWNAAQARASGPIFMHCGDDIIFRTESWDAQVRAAFERFDDRILFVYARDGYQHEGFGTHGFLHQRWIDHVGYFVPPYFSSDYNDTWLNEVAQSVGRHWLLPDVLTEHMHFIAHKGEIDEVHRERMARGSADNVAALYGSLRSQRLQDVDRLRSAIASHGGTLMEPQC
jgi:hypothetical protein